MDDFQLWDQVDCDSANTDCDLSGKYRQQKTQTEDLLRSLGYSAMVDVLIYNLPVKESAGLYLVLKTML